MKLFLAATLAAVLTILMATSAMADDTWYSPTSTAVLNLERLTTELENNAKGEVTVLSAEQIADEIRREIDTIRTEQTKEE